MLGYMITWITYGTWLQGDERGYVKDGLILPANEQLEDANRKLQVQDAVCLSETQQKVVREAILKQAAARGQKVLAISVQPTHVHIVLENIAEPIDKIVAYYKTAGRLALKAVGYTGKVWTRSYDKRFCFDEESLNRRIQYVENQNRM
jgi:REP element-mobilizing transposase RayT